MFLDGIAIAAMVFSLFLFLTAATYREKGNTFTADDFWTVLGMVVGFIIAGELLSWGLHHFHLLP